MKIGIVTDRRQSFPAHVPPCDLLMLPFGALGEVDYASELSGKTNKLERLAKLSGAHGCGVTCGVITNSRGTLRKSVAVAASGKLLGIADMLHVPDGEDYKSGATLGVYQAGGYRIGVVVDGDVCFPECIKSLAMCGCNLIAVHAQNTYGGMAPTLIRAYAYLYGVPVASNVCGAAYFADVTGVIASGNQKIAVFETSPKSCYRLVTTRRRGLIEGLSGEF